MAATALVIQECQNGVIGPDSLLPRLAEAAAPAVPFIARLAHGARAASVPVIHALATTRADGYGEPRNAPLYRMAARAGKPLLAGTPAAEAAIIPRSPAFGVPAFTIVGRSCRRTV